MTSRWRGWIIVGAAAAIVVSAMPTPVQADGTESSAQLSAAQTQFYNGRYAEAAAATADLCKAAVEALPACELRSSAILFQIRRAIGEAPDKDKAFKQCAVCDGLFTTFITEIRQAQGVARAHLKTNPGDEQALFFLGK